MSIVRTLIGNIKGPAGATGATGATGAAGANGADGAAATVNVGTVSTTAYGNPAQVINSGTESAAVLDFVIPQGQPGEEVTDMSGLTLGTMTTQTSQFPTPQIGDNGATLWGKVVKYFSDLRTLIGTKLNTANVVNNFTTTESGYALDARAGKTLNDSLVKRFTTATITNQLRYGFGWVTSGGMRLNIVIPAAVEGPVTNISATSFKISMRIPGGGYIIGDAADITSYLELQTVTLQGFIFVFYKSDGWGAPNNTPVTGGVTMSAVIS